MPVKILWQGKYSAPQSIWKRRGILTNTPRGCPSPWATRTRPPSPTAFIGSDLDHSSCSWSKWTSLRAGFRCGERFGMRSRPPVPWSRPMDQAPLGFLALTGRSTCIKTRSRSTLNHFHTMITIITSCHNNTVASRVLQCSLVHKPRHILLLLALTSVGVLMDATAETIVYTDLTPPGASSSVAI